MALVLNVDSKKRFCPFDDKVTIQITITSNSVQDMLLSTVSMVNRRVNEEGQQHLTSP